MCIIYNNIYIACHSVKPLENIIYNYTMSFAHFPYIMPSHNAIINVYFNVITHLARYILNLCVQISVNKLHYAAAHYYADLQLKGSIYSQLQSRHMQSCSVPVCHWHKPKARETYDSLKQNKLYIYYPSNSCMSQLTVYIVCTPLC